MSVSPVSQHVPPPSTEAVERPGPDHDGDRDDAAAAAVAAPPAPGQAARGGGIYL